MDRCNALASAAAAVCTQPPTRRSDRAVCDRCVHGDRVRPYLPRHRNASSPVSRRAPERRAVQPHPSAAQSLLKHKCSVQLRLGLRAAHPVGYKCGQCVGVCGVGWGTLPCTSANTLPSGTLPSAFSWSTWYEEVSLAISDVRDRSVNTHICRIFNVQGLPKIRLQ